MSISSNALIESFIRVLSEAQAIDTAKQAKLIEQAKNSNQGKEPTIDVYGRLHAPFNGYVLEDSIYKGGEYLPVEYMNKNDTGHKTRFKTEVSNVEALKRVFKGINLTCGKSWQQDNNEICYCYISGISSNEMKAIDDNVAIIEKEQKAKLLANRNVLEEGKQDITATIIKSFGKYNHYSNEFDTKLELKTDNNCVVIVSVTNKIWDLVNDNIDELLNKQISFTATIKQIKDKKHQANRPSKIKLL